MVPPGGRIWQLIDLYWVMGTYKSDDVFLSFTFCGEGAPKLKKIAISN